MDAGPQRRPFSPFLLEHAWVDGCGHTIKGKQGGTGLSAPFGPSRVGWCKQQSRVVQATG
eukprot:70179-Chlamydomonas_euryale.AAC.1